MAENNWQLFLHQGCDRVINPCIQGIRGKISFAALSLLGVLSAPAGSFRCWSRVDPFGTGVDTQTQKTHTL